MPHNNMIIVGVSKRNFSWGGPKNTLLPHPPRPQIVIYIYYLHVWKATRILTTPHELTCLYVIMQSHQKPSRIQEIFTCLHQICACLHLTLDDYIPYFCTVTRVTGDCCHDFRMYVHKYKYMSWALKRFAWLQNVDA